MGRLYLLTATLLAGTFSAEAPAQPVFRCGNSYSQVPCADGRTVDVADPRGPAQQAEALRVAVSERALAESLRRDRMADERTAA